MIEIIWDLGPEVALHCVDDAVTGNSYVYTSSDVPNFAEAYLHPAEEEIETWSVGELIREVDRATDPVQRGKAIVRMAIAASYETDEEVARRMSEALRSDDYALRDLTLWAMSICSYPVFRPLLRDIARSDSSEVLRQRAQMLLEAYDGAGVEES
ncbi:MAG: HEAT repeat domain-containing protein [Streptosporangiaceae bacterium]|nr:HEAT repeat domain-containing protein [Streptosporangiaceae bacterium]MBV9858311.1 HEAT repeat domain-containing protein [Streptosporangiaceae bacterium]